MGQSEAWAECCVCFEDVPVSGLARMDSGAPMNVCLRCVGTDHRIACRRCGTSGPWGDEPYLGLCGDCAHRVYVAEGGR